MGETTHVPFKPPAVAHSTVDLSCYVASVPQRVLLEKLRHRLRSSRSEVAPRIAETLELDTPADFGEGHPVVVESWQVRAGATLFGDVDQEIWARHAGTVWGAMAACTLAASMVGARGATNVTPFAKERFGSYREVIVLVPYVRLKAFDTAASFVAGMHTESNSARMVDRSFGYGFAKQPARIAHDARGLRVASITGRSQLRTSEEQPDMNVVDAPDYWQQPLLGMSTAGALALSHLTRSPSNPGLGIHARLHVEHDARWLLPRSDYPIAGQSLRGVRFELSAPQHLH